MVSTRVVEQFFAAHVGPELQAVPLHPERAMFRAACFKLVMQPVPIVLSVLPADSGTCETTQRSTQMLLGSTASASR